MRDLLKNTGMRWTRQRQQIYDEIVSESGHFTAESIREKISSKNIKTGLSTIYRTLQLLEEKDIVKRIPIGKDTAVYECNDGTTHGHHHMHCKDCGKTLEIHVDMLDDIEKLIANKYNFRVRGHTVMFTGICDNCSKASLSESGDNKSE